MKKKLILIVLSSFLTYANACDICGCGAGSYYIGILPDFNKRFVGLRYQFNKLTTQLDVNGNRTTLTSDEQYQNVELWGAWNFGSRWRIMAIVPYNLIEKYNNASETLRRKDGLGDVVLNGYFNILNKTGQSDNKLIVHSLWGGLGLKLPTGNYSVQEVNNNLNSPNIFQLGTGSTDVLANIMYDIRIHDIGINTNFSYKLNTENADDYRYGDKISANVSAYYKINLGIDKRLAPNIGVAYEHQQKDHTLGYRLTETGGSLVNSILGLETNFKQLSLGINYQLPLQQDLGKRRIESGNKFLTHISYSF
ncbi:transporter family protein [Sphingobacterium lumbrici]|uniref:transporter n=1 Tax=Sphingobacterium lumbrici TaxID=2559600 RepID=UPI001125BA55|nr:transporter [Sphingobacterium lumbrici]